MLLSLHFIATCFLYKQEEEGEISPRHLLYDGVHCDNAADSINHFLFFKKKSNYNYYLQWTSPLASHAIIFSINLFQFQHSGISSALSPIGFVHFKICSVNLTRIRNSIWILFLHLIICLQNTHLLAIYLICKFNLVYFHHQKRDSIPKAFSF